MTLNINHNEVLSIPTKICDGIFMSDMETAQDHDWLELNQVTHIINCAGRHYSNQNRIEGISFLTFDWSEDAIQNILEQSVIASSVGLIEEARRESGTVLLHYYRSQSRPFCILAAYFMIKYQWNLFKTLEFLNSRKEDIELEPSFFQQLTTLHQKLHQKGLIKSKNWSTEPIHQDQIILTNTFLNSKKKTINQQFFTKPKQNNQCVSWKNNNLVTHFQYDSNSVIAQIDKKVGVNRQNSRQSKDSKQRNESLKKEEGKPQNIKEKDKEKSHKEKLLKENKDFKQNKQPKESKERNDSVKRQEERELMEQKEINKIKTTLNAQKNIVGGQKSTSLTEMNVTKKWNELRESWIKQKQNFNVNNPNSSQLGIIYLTS